MKEGDGERGGEGGERLKTGNETERKTAEETGGEEEGLAEGY